MDTGSISPGTMADDATVGTITWTNSNNAKVSDDVYVTATVGNETTHYLKATNYGFSIPVGAIINGILIEIEKKITGAGDGSSLDNAVKIVKSDGTIGATNKASAIEWSTTEAYISYGSSSDLWGETWVYTDINDVDFGVVLSATRSLGETGTRTFNVDHIRITVYYTTIVSPFPSFFQDRVYGAP